MSFSYATPITVTANRDLSNIPVLATVNTSTLIANGQMLSDCSDAAVVDSNYSLVPFYIDPDTCNTTTTRVWFRAPLTSGTTATYYLLSGSAVRNLARPKDVFLIYEDFITYSDAVWYGSTSNLYMFLRPYTYTVRLTPNSTWQTGILAYPRVANNPYGFYAKIKFWVSDNYEGLWFGMYDTRYTGIEEDVVAGGYHFTFDEGQARICFTKSTTSNGAGIACYSTTTINNAQWHTGEIYFYYDGTQACAQIYYDGTQAINTCDTAPQAITGTANIYTTLGARTSGNTPAAEHRTAGPFYVAGWWPNAYTVSVGTTTSGTYTVNLPVKTGSALSTALYGTVSANKLLTSGAVRTGTVASTATYGRIVANIFPTSGVSRSAKDVNQVDYGVKCSLPSIPYAVNTYDQDGKPILGGYVYIYSQYPKFYGESIIVNGIALMCVPISPDRVASASYIIVDQNRNAYVASLSGVAPLYTVSGTTIYTATLKAISRLVTPITFAIDKTKL